MAVTTEPAWVNKTSGLSARNGTASHTIPFGWTAGTGTFLLFIVVGAVTNTNSGGWTERLQPVVSAELSVFTKTGAGETSITVANNGSNYPLAWTAYEFPAGTTYTAGVGSSPSADTFPALTGLPGTAQVIIAARARAQTATDSSGSSTWAAPWVEDADITTSFATTDGIYLTVGHQLNVTATSITPTASTTFNGGQGVGDREHIVVALNVAAGATTITTSGTATAKGVGSATTATTRTKTATGTARASATRTTATTRTSARTASAVASASAVTQQAPTVITTTGTATAKAAGSATQAATHATARSAAAKAVGTGVSSAMRSTARTASAIASASASRSGVHTTVGTAMAKAVASQTSGTTHSTSGSGTAHAVATYTTTSVRTKTGTGTARATASAVTSQSGSGVTSGSAVAKATATAITGSVRTVTGVASAKATAASTTAMPHQSVGTGSARASASYTLVATHTVTADGTALISAGATTTTLRVSSGLGQAIASAFAQSGNPSDFRDVDLVVGRLYGHDLSAVLLSYRHSFEVGEPFGHSFINSKKATT